MNIQNVLNDLKAAAPAPVKTASAQPTNVDAARAALAQSINNATSSTKTASEGDSAVAQLSKIASELASADEVSQVKQAQLFGAAVFDGFVAKANTYAAQAPQQKVAEYADNSASVKIAADLGYAESENAIMRMAAQNTKTAAHQEKTAAEAGYVEADAAIARMSGGTKTAAEIAVSEEWRGIQDGAVKIAAAAEDCFNRGFEQMAQISEALS